MCSSDLFPSHDRKQTQYSAEFKTKIVLEVLKGDKTINEIASEYNIILKNIQNCKNIFLSNAVVAMETAKAVQSKVANTTYKVRLNQTKTSL